MDNQFLRTQMLLGDAAMERLKHSHVAVFGLGGVGSYAVEALVRSGVGELTLIDDDTVGTTNLNRQLEALHSTLGQNKTDALAARCREADILLAAAGAPGLITPACVHPEQIVLDAGVTALPDGTLLGDVAAEAAEAVAACTPVPGGVGSVTTALLLLHTVQSAEIFHQF